MLRVAGEKERMMEDWNKSTNLYTAAVLLLRQVPSPDEKDY